MRRNKSGKDVISPLCLLGAASVLYFAEIIKEFQQLRGTCSMRCGISASLQ